jgi:hypothetical protein
MNHLGYYQNVEQNYDLMKKIYINLCSQKDPTLPLGSFCEQNCYMFVNKR